MGPPTPSLPPPPMPSPPPSPLPPSPPLPLSTPPACTATGYVCHSAAEASTTYCQMWASDSVCYSGSCMTPLDCSPDATSPPPPQPPLPPPLPPLVVDPNQACTATGDACHGRPEASTTYCQMWASDSVCYSGSCMTPLNCSPDARHVSEANEGERLIYDESLNDDRANNERWNSQR